MFPDVGLVQVADSHPGVESVESPPAEVLVEPNVQGNVLINSNLFYDFHHIGLGVISTVEDFRRQIIQLNRGRGVLSHTGEN